MKTAARQWILAILIGAFLALGAQWIWNSFSNVNGYKNAKPKLPADEGLTSLQIAERRYATTLERARDRIHSSVLLPLEDALRQGVRKEAYQIEHSQFNCAIRIVGEFSSDITEAEAILRKALISKDSIILSLAGQAIARISIRASANRGERVSVDERFLPLWGPDARTAGNSYIDVFLEGKPNGYLDTIVDWLGWLTNDERLPKTLFYEPINGAFPNRVYASLKIIVCLDYSQDEHYKKVGTKALQKLESRYANDAGLSNMLKIVTGLRSSEEGRIQDRKDEAAGLRRPVFDL